MAIERESLNATLLTEFMVALAQSSIQIFCGHKPCGNV